MTGTGETSSTENTQDEPRFSSTYLHLPWLVAHGEGPESEELAERVLESLRRQGVDHLDAMAVDEVDERHLVKYPVLVFIAPTALAPGRSMTRARRRYGDIMTIYRRWRTQGLSAVLAGRERDHLAGVVQVVVLGDAELLRRSEVFRPLLDQVCILHEVAVEDPTTVPDLLSVFDGQPAPGPLTGPRPVDRVEALWGVARAWGVDTAEQVHEIISLIDRCRSRYEAESFSYSRTPHPHYDDCNILDMVLDHHEVKYPRNRELSDEENLRLHNRFVATGASAARYAVDYVNQTYPAFRRPGNRKTKGAQGELYAIYTTLKMLQRVLDAERLEGRGS